MMPPNELLDEAYDLLKKPSADSFWSGCRRIFRYVTFKWATLPEIRLEDFGYTKSKLNQLRKHYINVESLEIAQRLWIGRRERDKYGSVSFTTYNHYVKSEKKSPRGSVMGPCIQAVVITYLARKTYDVAIYYRTSELFKKFPADLALLREMLSGFDFEGLTCKGYTFQFVNLTLHPMYFPTVLQTAPNRILALKALDGYDSKFHEWVIKWLARYLIPKYEHGIQKFAQAMRTGDHAKSIFAKEKTLLAYLEKNHPGYKTERNAAYHTDEEEEE